MKLYRGLFWLINGELVVVKLACDSFGTFTDETPISLRGKTNLTHSEEWKKLPKSITGGLPYNHYPRGRVEIKNNRADVFLNPDIANEGVLAKIRAAFFLDSLKSVRVHADGSAHYTHKQ